MAYSDGAASYELNYSINPIALTNGIASSIPGAALSVAGLLQSLNASTITSPSDFGIDTTFAKFYPIAGDTLVDNQIGNYPFANMAIAANAIINQPLKVSLLMRVPASAVSGGYQGKLALMTSLQNTLAQHIANEGTFAVATPSFYYSDVLLVTLTDVSAGETNQVQVEWRWDFIKPLISQSGATIATNNMMTALSSGGPTSGDPSGIGSNVGNPTNAQSSGVVTSNTSAISGISNYPPNFYSTTVAQP